MRGNSGAGLGQERGNAGRGWAAPADTPAGVRAGRGAIRRARAGAISPARAHCCAVSWIDQSAVSLLCSAPRADNATARQQPQPRASVCAVSSIDQSAVSLLVSPTIVYPTNRANRATPGARIGGPADNVLADCPHNSSPTRAHRRGRQTIHLAVGHPMLCRPTRETETLKRREPGQLVTT